ncbi:xanthine dehydrogenase family protein molybdopterin-binding subunit [Roseibacterium sp. KMU-115]|uniref:Xanthine dehydrogenase family protein molybdopterin-binding subunit n=1 Tax=Roseicyclus persicicus TaxID=2650661 RepID=A0A7X6GXM6_9RHOB|nr:xanthine dehydrogenase family protein molybdopterin-binding subunit [Roseibacterium persicicum]
MTKAVGAPLPRREDPTLLKGAGRYTADIRLDNPLHIAFLRSPVAAGRIRSIDASEALAAPGVAAVLTGADLPPNPPPDLLPVLEIEATLPFPMLARDRVTAVGEPVAAILADSPARAADAVDLVMLEIDEAELPEPRRIARKRWQAGDAARAFAAAAHVVEVETVHPRVAPSPMEPRGVAIRYDAETEGVTIFHSTQTPHRTKSDVTRILQLDPDRVRVVAPDVGGGFGMKGFAYPEEVFAVWAALHLRRDVRWIATRSEEFLSAAHGRGLTSRGRLALDADGRFLGLEARIEAPLGNWATGTALMPAYNAARILPSGYVIPALDIAAEAHAHPLPSVGIYRGAGRPEANVIIERLIEEAAAATGLDPVEIRKRNLLPAEAMPHDTATGNRLDSGDYAAALDAFSAAADLDSLRARRDAIRAGGGIAGLGVAFYVDPSAHGWEYARVTLNADGTAHIATGATQQGHGRLTAFSQIASDALGIPIEAISLEAGDTGSVKEGIGAVGSRATAIGGSALMEACAKAKALVEGGAPLPVTAESKYEVAGQAWAFGAYAALVQIDPETGVARLLRAHAHDDTGVMVNPVQVEGQIRGGFAQAVGETMLEAIVLDGDGQLLTGSFMDYAMPRAGDIPWLTLSHSETPSPMNPLGAKGVGEAATTGAPAALINAITDAFRPTGKAPPQMPFSPSRIWAALNG